MTLPALVTTWQSQGEVVPVAGHDIFVVDRGRLDAPALVLLHGFPGSSFDWRLVVDALAPRWRVLTFDFLGYGLSAKPDQAYSLFDQADLVEELLAAKGVDRAVLVAHDMGDTVAAELLARSVAAAGAPAGSGDPGRSAGDPGGGDDPGGSSGAGDPGDPGGGSGGGSGIEWAGCLLTNGSIFIDMAQLTAGQLGLLALPDEMTAGSLGEEGMAAGLRASFPPDRPDPEEMQAMVALILHADGDRLLPRLIRYIEERRAHQPRWTAGLVDYPGPMVVAWGDLDPIAVPAMADRLAALRAAARRDVELVHWPEIGHWPSVEDPSLVAGLVADRLSFL